MCLLIFRSLGSAATNFYITEYMHVKFPNLPGVAVLEAVSHLTGRSFLAAVAREIGLNHAMRWKVAEKDPDSTRGEATVAAYTFEALIGGVLHEKGAKAAREFVHKYLLSNELDVPMMLKFKNAKRMLTALIRRQGGELPESRIISESGRTSTNAVFVIGVFSGRKKLGEGVGRSIKLAEQRVRQLL